MSSKSIRKRRRVQHQGQQIMNLAKLLAMYDKALADIENRVTELEVAFKKANPDADTQPKAE